jgi:outer membrane lipoprotein-sorting protein
MHRGYNTLSGLRSSSLFLGEPEVVAQPDVHAISEKVDQRYNRIQTLQAQFAETYSAGMTRKESGTLELKSQGGCADYDQPVRRCF